MELSCLFVIKLCQIFYFICILQSLRGLRISFYLLRQCLMSISIDQWHASVGFFYSQVYGHIRIKLSIGSCDLKVVMLFCSFSFFTSPETWTCWDQSWNPRKKKQDFFYCFHWNVNSILAHNKLPLLEADNTTHKYDILCISETYLDFSVSVDDTTLSLPGYNLVVVFFSSITTLYTRM